MLGQIHMCMLAASDVLDDPELHFHDFMSTTIKDDVVSHLMRTSAQAKPVIDNEALLANVSTTVGRISERIAAMTTYNSPMENGQTRVHGLLATASSGPRHAVVNHIYHPWL